jgi:diguanylate cyclase (GGDEF)-like protein/PAS domain S-box-containing protein
VADQPNGAGNADDLAAKGSYAGGVQSVESLVEGAKKRGRRGPSLGARFESLPWLWQGAFWGLVCALVTSALGALNFTRGLEGAAMDTLFRARNWRGARYPSPHVALVVVDEETVARYGFPVPRSRYAELVRRLKKDGARTIAFDISFSTPGNPAREDAELVRACREAGIVIHPAVIHVPETLSALEAQVSPDARNQRTLPLARLGWRNLDPHDRHNLPDGVGGFSALPALQDGAAAIGHINVFPERDNGTLRRVPHLIRYKGRVYPSLSLAAATHALGVAPNDVLLRNGELIVGRNADAPHVPLARRWAEHGETLVNWVGGHSTFNHYSVERVLSNVRSEKYVAGTFKDRIVLIGATNAAAFDYHPTPFAPAQPAVEMQANAIDDILSGRQLREISPPLQTALLWLLPIVLGALVAGRNARWTLWTTLAAVSACFAAALWLFHANMYWPYASPLLALGCTAAACVSYRQLRDAAHLKAAEQRYALAVRAANDGIWDWDLASGYVYYAPRWKEMLGLADSKVEPLPSEWLGRVHPDDRPSVEYELGEHLQGYTPAFGAEFRMRHADGSNRWVLARALMVRGEDGRPARLAGSLSDITSRRMAEEKLVRQALSDELTGLPNRVLFLDRLQKAIARSQRHPEYAFAVLFLDLDRFKIVNDSLGHLVGDEMLQAVARRLESCLRPGDTVARMGGDEFTLLIEDIAGVVTATTVAERIHARWARRSRSAATTSPRAPPLASPVSMPPPQPLPVLSRSGRHPNT